MFGQALGAITKKVLGPSQGSQKRSQRRDFQNQKELINLTGEQALDQITLGNEMDLSNQKDMFDYRINQGIAAGMTPYEMYMGPAAGAGGGTTGSGQTLGNAANQRGIALQQAQQQNSQQNRLLKQQSAENNADRLTTLAQTAIQAKTQKDVAEVQAGTATRGQDIDERVQMARQELEREIAEGQLNLGRDQFNANVQRIAVQNALDLKQVEKLVNDIATSHPDFVMRLKQLTMGKENMIVEYFQRHHKINLYEPESFMSLPYKEREALVAKMINIGSPLYAAAGAIKDQGGQTVDDLITTLGNAPSAMWDVYKESYNNLTNGGLGNYFRKKQRPADFGPSP